MPHLTAKHLQPDLPDPVVDTDKHQLSLFENFTLLKSSVLGHNLDETPVVVANTVVETTVLSYILLGSSYDVGDTLHLKLLSQYSNATASDDFTIRVKLGATTLATVSRVGGAVTAVGLRIDIDLLVAAIGASGIIKDFVTVLGDGEIYTRADANGHSTDFTVAQNLIVTFQWANAKAGNTVTFFAATLAHMHTED